MQPITRRRFLQITAVAGAAAALPFASLASQRQYLYRWRGIVLGADAGMQIYLPQQDKAKALVQSCLTEITRLERIFSLHDPHSSLSQLNRDGYLDAPPPELVELMTVAQRFSAMSNGAFDMTVQPLWQLYAAQPAPSPAAVAEALRRVDYRKVEIEHERIDFATSGMQVTLNGIAQGYITDRVTMLLKDGGIERTLVDMGETRALGSHPAGRPWQAAVRDPLRQQMLVATLPLSNQALATSGGYGTRLDAAGNTHHLFDPVTGQSASHFASVSVVAPDATTADALSTALYILPQEKGLRLIQALPKTGALFIQPDGKQISAL